MNNKMTPYQHLTAINTRVFNHENAIPHIIFWTLFIAGVTIRIWHFGSGRSLWVDEVWIAENILARSYSELTRPLDNHQMAPLGWLFLVKAASHIALPVEYTLRLPALFAGLTALIFIWLSALRHFSFGWACLVLTFSAFNPVLIYFSAEIKPYSFDIMFASIFLYLGIRILNHNTYSQLDLFLCFIVGIISLTLSSAVAFVLASLGSIVVSRELLNTKYFQATKVGVVSMIWLIFFYYTQIDLHLSDKSVMSAMKDSYWGWSFAPFPPQSIADLAWYYERSFHLFEYSFGYGDAAGAGLVAFICGALLGVKTRDDIWRKMFVTCPILFALLASALSMYPFESRLIAFYVPFCIFTVCCGLREIFQFSRIVSSVIALILIVSSFYASFEMAARSKPFEVADMKSVFDVLEDEVTSDDYVYVYNTAIPAFQFYLERRSLNTDLIVFGRSPEADTSYFLSDFECLRGTGKVFAVFSHLGDGRSIYYTLFDEVSELYAEKEAVYEFTDAKLLVLDFNEDKQGRYEPSFTSPEMPYVSPHPGFSAELCEP